MANFLQKTPDGHLKLAIEGEIRSAFMSSYYVPLQ